MTVATTPLSRSRGFTLIELLLALTLMAGIAAILFGSLSLASRSWEGGEAKAEQVGDMRAAQTYLRGQLSEQYPQRMWKAVDVPLLFAGEKNELRYAAVLPERVAGGGVYYFRLAVAANGDKSQLVQERIVPDLTQIELPAFREPDRSVLAEGIAELAISYYGRDANAADVDAPTWRDRWEDKQRLPLLLKIDVKPVKGLPWPTLVVEPRRAPEAGCPVWDQGSSRCLRSGGRGAMKTSPPRVKQQGIALIVVLWLTVLIAVIGSSFAYSMRGEAMAARNTMSLAQARAAADGAVERTAFELSRARVSPDAWSPDGQPHTFNDGDIAITVVAFDESARIDLNSASEPLLKGLLQQVGGLDAESAAREIDAIIDWRDADDLKRPNGAEAPDYQAAGSKYVPTNSPFESVGELQRVLGVTPELMARLAGTLTIYSRQQGINPATASRSVLLAIPTVTAEQVDTYIAARDDAAKNRLPVPPFPQAQGFATGASPVWRIHVQARTPDGVTFARDAVLRPLVDPRRPLVTLLWQEGALDPVSAPAPTGNSAQENGTGKP